MTNVYSIMQLGLQNADLKRGKHVNCVPSNWIYITILYLKFSQQLEQDIGQERRGKP